MTYEGVGKVVRGTDLPRVSDALRLTHFVAGWDILVAQMSLGEQALLKIPRYAISGGMQCNLLIEEYSQLGYGPWYEMDSRTPLHVQHTD